MEKTKHLFPKYLSKTWGKWGKVNFRRRKETKFQEKQKRMNK